MPSISLRFSHTRGYTVYVDGEAYVRQEKRPMARRKRPTRPLTCYGKLRDGTTCGETSPKRLRVSGSTQQRSLGNRDGSMTKRRVAEVECTTCGNEFLSRHPQAIALADKHDLNRDRRHGRQKVSA